MKRAKKSFNQNLNTFPNGWMICFYAMGFVNHKISNSKISHYIIRHQKSNFTLAYEDTLGSPIWVNNIAVIVRVI